MKSVQVCENYKCIYEIFNVYIYIYVNRSTNKKTATCTLAGAIFQPYTKTYMKIKQSIKLINI